MVFVMSVKVSVYCAPISSLLGSISIPIKVVFLQEKITVIGRYRDSEYQMYDGYVHQIEILDVNPQNTLFPAKYSVN